MDYFVSGEYLMGCAAYRIPRARWQDPDVEHDPRVREFMKKVDRICDEEQFSEAKLKDPEASPQGIIVETKQGTFKEVALYNRGAAREGYRNTDEELIAKFRENVLGILPPDKTNKAVQTILELEKLENAAELMEMVVP